MISIEYLRRAAARRACLGLAAGLATVCVAATAHAEGEGEGGSTLSRSIFAPVSPTDKNAASPLAAPAVQQALAAAQAERPVIATRPAEEAAAAAALAPAAPHVAAAPASAIAHLASNAAIAFGFPLPGYSVNSRFGLRQLSFEPHARMHDGVDIAAPSGTQIHAAAPGVVTRTGLSSSYGNFVEVALADGLTAFYAHMSRTAGLKPGAKVSGGEVLGLVGSTGHSTGPHLHFEIRKGGEPLDPQDFMGRQFASAADLPLAEARAPTLMAGLRHPLHMLASFHVRGGRRGATFRYAELHHLRHTARG